MASRTREPKSWTLHLPRGKPGDAVVAGDDDDGVVEFAEFLDLLDEHVAGGVEGHGLAEVVGHVLADQRDVGQERRELALQVIGLEAPQRLAGAADPLAVGVGRVERVEERLALLALGEEVAEVAAHLVEDLLLGGRLVLAPW